MAEWPRVITPCDYALRDAIYQSCPRDVHGFDGPRCLDCPVLPATATAPTYKPLHGGYPA